MTDLESRLMLALGILDHRMALRDRYQGDALDDYLERVLHDTVMALNGASIEQILESRAA
jgi:hypothetical protein